MTELEERLTTCTLRWYSNEDGLAHTCAMLAGHIGDHICPCGRHGVNIEGVAP